MNYGWILLKIQMFYIGGMAQHGFQLLPQSQVTLGLKPQGAHRIKPIMLNKKQTITQSNMLNIK
ncbi:hypothetical protein BKM15_25980 [Pseudomonas syringae pv. syringae]|nr:hypothetical protein BKM15_25980 [Pseudomonas syringae pv. syringae]